MIHGKRHLHAIDREFSIVEEDSRVVDQDVKLVVAVRDICCKPPNLLLGSKICDKELYILISRGLSNLLDHALSTLRFAAMNENRGAKGGKFQRCLSSDAVG